MILWYLVSNTEENIHAVPSVYILSEKDQNHAAFRNIHKLKYIVLCRYSMMLINVTFSLLCHVEEDLSDSYAVVHLLELLK